MRVYSDIHSKYKQYSVLYNVTAYNVTGWLILESCQNLSDAPNWYIEKLLHSVIHYKLGQVSQCLPNGHANSKLIIIMCLQMCLFENNIRFLHYNQILQRFNNFQIKINSKNMLMGYYVTSRVESFLKPKYVQLLQVKRIVA